MLPKNRPPSHPGEILQNLFLDDLGLTQVDLAKHLGCKASKINEIVNKKRGITSKTALLLADAFKCNPEFWLNLQNTYDLWNTRQNYKSIKPLKVV